MRTKLSKGTWTEREEKIFTDVLKKNEEYILDYSFQLLAQKLHRSLSAIKQHYYYSIKKKTNSNNIKAKFIEVIKQNDYKVVKHKHLFIVTV
jgi:hypothetical protein